MLKIKFIIAVVLLLLAIVGAWCCGAVDILWQDWFDLLNFNVAGNVKADILWQIRLPRVLGAAMAGCLLAAAGCTVQLLFRNPLSSPHVLGAVNAAALGAVLVMSMGVASMSMMLLGSTLGALTSLLLLLFIGRGYRQTATLLLAGIALNAFASAAMSGVLFVAGERLEGIVFWLLGGFWRLDWPCCWILSGSFAVVLLMLINMHREMDMLYLGERAAAAAGVNTRRVIGMAVLAAALATAAVVGNCGVIGFVGLLIPHIARRFFGSNFRTHLWGAVLSGAILMVLADWAARTLWSPLEIPVGILTSLIGAPFFFVLIVGKLKTPGEL